MHEPQKTLLSNIIKQIYDFVEEKYPTDKEETLLGEEANKRTAIIRMLLVNLTLNVIELYSNDKHQEAFAVNILEYVGSLSKMGAFGVSEYEKLKSGEDEYND
jgi:hypothetical protein